MSEKIHFHLAHDFWGSISRLNSCISLVPGKDGGWQPEAEFRKGTYGKPARTNSSHAQFRLEFSNQSSPESFIPGACSTERTAHQAHLVSTLIGLCFYLLSTDNLALWVLKSDQAQMSGFHFRILKRHILLMQHMLSFLPQHPQSLSSI